MCKRIVNSDLGVFGMIDGRIQARKGSKEIESGFNLV